MAACGKAQLFRHDILAELADAGEQAPSLDGQAERLAVELQEVVQLLDHDEPVDRGGELAQQPHGQRPDEAQLQNRGLRAAGLLHILVAGARGDDAELAGALFPAVAGRALGPGGERREPLLHDRVAQLGVARHHDVFLRILFINLLRHLDAPGERHDALRVGHARAHLQQHRRVELLGEGIGELGEFQRLLRVGRLEHRQLRGLGVVPGVLLVLRGVHARVVGDADDESRADAGVAHREERVGRDVEPDVLHGAEAAPPGETRAEAGLHGDLLVGRPLGVDLGELGDGLGDFGAGRAGVAADEAAARLIQAARDGLVAQEQGFVHDRSSLSKSPETGRCLTITLPRRRWLPRPARRPSFHSRRTRSPQTRGRAPWSRDLRAARARDPPP